MSESKRIILRLPAHSMFASASRMPLLSAPTYSSALICSHAVDSSELSSHGVVSAGCSWDVKKQGHHI